MTYAGYATLKPEASDLRLAELSRQLKRLNCHVHIDPERSKLEFQLCDGDDMWQTTGELTLLFIRFQDIVGAQRHGYEETPLGLQA